MEQAQKPSEQIVEMLRKQLNKKAAEVTPDKRIKEDLGADSLDVVEILMNVEEKFGITVPDDVVLGISTVGDLIAVIDKISTKK
jgi:acyl carrier protein